MANAKNFEIDATVKTYFDSLKRYKTLTKEEEHELVKKYRQHNDLAARNKLITANLRYACQLANNYRNHGVSYSDLISEANNGLIESIDKFDLSQDVKLFSYSKWWMMQKMQLAIKKKLDMPESDLPMDNEAPIEENDDDVAVVSNGSLQDNTFITDDEADENENDLKGFLDKVMSVLSDREADIINMYYGRCGYKENTLEEIGKKYMLTKERVRQIMETAFRKVRSESMLVDNIYLSR